MNWTHDVPAVVGEYLRQPSSLKNHRPSAVAVFEINGEMCISNFMGGFNAIRLAKWRGASKQWWYGPIPSPLESGETPHNSVSAEIIRAMKSLTDDERMEVMSRFCKHCGRDNPRCQCWNDE